MTALSRRSLFGWLAAAPAAVTGMVEAVKAAPARLLIPWPASAYGQYGDARHLLVAQAEFNRRRTRMLEIVNESSTRIFADGDLQYRGVIIRSGETSVPLSGLGNVECLDSYEDHGSYDDDWED